MLYVQIRNMQSRQTGFHPYWITQRSPTVKSLWQPKPTLVGYLCILHQWGNGNNQLDITRSLAYTPSASSPQSAKLNNGIIINILYYSDKDGLRSEVRQRPSVDKWRKLSLLTDWKSNYKLIWLEIALVSSETISILARRDSRIKIISQIYMICIEIQICKYYLFTVSKNISTYLKHW